MEIIKYVFESTFWMWAACFACGFFAFICLYNWHDEKKRWGMALLGIFLGLSAYCFGSVAKNNRLHNCVLEIMQAENKYTADQIKRGLYGNTAYYMPYEVKQAICENR